VLWEYGIWFWHLLCFLRYKSISKHHFLRNLTFFDAFWDYFCKNGCLKILKFYKSHNEVSPIHFTLYLGDIFQFTSLIFQKSRESGDFSILFYQSCCFVCLSAILGLSFNFKLKISPQTLKTALMFILCIKIHHFIVISCFVQLKLFYRVRYRYLIQHNLSQNQIIHSSHMFTACTKYWYLLQKWTTDTSDINYFMK